MKILHTSDWHLGHTLYNYDRADEQEAMLLQMVEIVKEHKPDVFLLSGDVFHTSQPSAAIQTLLSEKMVELHRAHPDMVIIMTAGNHDSGSKHEIYRAPWLTLNVRAIGHLNRENPEEHIVEIPGKGYVVAVPYVNERNIPEGLFPSLINKVEQLNAGGLPVALMAHTTVQGVDFTGHAHASERNVGGIDAVELAEFGAGYDYIALGHIHRPQFVHSGHHNVRYCGSPLPVSFDECYPHSVSLVEIDGHGSAPRIDTIEIVNPHPLVTLPAVGFASWEQAKKLLEEYPDDIPAYIRLNVEVDDYLPPLAHADASLIAEHKQCRFCLINTRRATSASRNDSAMSVQHFREASPIEIARQFVIDQGREFSTEIEKLFNEAAKAVAEEQRLN